VKWTFKSWQQNASLLFILINFADYISDRTFVRLKTARSQRLATW